MRKLVAFFMAVSLLSSCKKEEDNEIKTEYLPLSIGNYWIYKDFKIDSSGNETANSSLDSVIITRDTIINRKKYYVLEGEYYPFNSGVWGIIDILRDSSGYIVNPNGTIQFSENDFKDTIAYNITTNMYNGDTLVVTTYQMEKPDNIMMVPAGNFEVLNYKGTVTTSMDTPGIEYPRYLNTYYAEGVGKILYTYFYIAGSAIYEKRLLRYHVN